MDPKMVREFLITKEAITHKYPSYFSTVIGTFHFLNIMDPKMVREFLITKEANFRKENPFIPLLRTIFGNGLLFSEGPVWKSERRIANKAFNAEALGKMAGLMEQACNQKLKAWKARQSEQSDGKISVNWDKEMRHLSLEIIGKCAFGSDYSTVTIDGKRTKLTDYTKALEDKVFAYGMSPIYFFFPKKFDLDLDEDTRELKRLRKAMKSIGKQIVENRVQEILKDPTYLETKTDLLNLMIRSHLDGRDPDECEDLLDLELLIDECVTFVFAGSETTSTLLEWTFYNLTKHPKALEKLQNELEHHFRDAFRKDPERIISNPRELDQLPYLDRVIQETLRMFPPAPAISPRVALKDIELGSLKVKKGTLVNVTSYLLQRSPFYWKDPTTFNPDREEFKNSELRFLPFSAGKRSCIGQFFALMEAKIAITKFVLEQNIACDLSSVERLQSAVTLSVNGGMNADVKCRDFI
eukprot:CAMPEP_0115028358 /NCGR_PEP_ID=MMETSP0216-20121206/36227_1 /TAXON_ID=223996 /ORGANISM="Protocruzia adherens, Strain Boccale" /LENGTH=467 /DNA_ID=CAMNT_0002404475 /DNA_START=296 /DNA_END=1699 /DNA_ORIENTATION=-